jgi:WD40 repeat protein
MNTRITCLLLFVIAHASAIAAPKFPLTLEAGIAFFSNGVFLENNLSVTSLDWSSDGKLLLSNGIKTVLKGNKKDFERHLAIWDAITWDEAKKKTVFKFRRSDTRAEFIDPKNNNRVAVTTEKGIGIINIKRPKDKPRILGKGLFTTKAGKGKWPNMYWSKDGRKFATHHFSNGKDDKDGEAISVIDAADGKKHTLSLGRVTFARERRLPPLISWSPDGEFLAFTGFQEILIYDSTLENELARYTSPRQIINIPPGGFSGLLEWSKDGGKLFVAGAFGKAIYIDTLLLPDLKKGRRKVLKKAHASIKLEPSGLQEIVLDPQARRIALGESKTILANGRIIRIDPVVRIYHLGTGKLLHDFDDIEPYVQSRKTQFTVKKLVWSPDGFKIAAGLDDGTIRIFKTPK